MAKCPDLAQLAIHHRQADGQVDSTQVGGIVESRDYNRYGELANLRYRIGSTVLLQQSITRDELGRATDIAETWSGLSGPESRTTHYDHDPDTGWLTRVSMNGSQVRQYVYDGGGVGNGNRTAEYGPGDVLIASATHDEQDRLKT